MIIIILVEKNEMIKLVKKNQMVKLVEENEAQEGKSFETQYLNFKVQTIWIEGWFEKGFGSRALDRIYRL